MEDAVCRVCHGESEENRPLFHPCKCSGSIKYVHQDCLMEWLKVSNKGEPKCELCGSKFYFRKMYSAGTPDRLSVMEFVSGVYPRIVRVLNIIGRVGGTLQLCVVFLPIWTWWIVGNTSQFLLGGDLQLDPLPYYTRPHHHPTFWWHGILSVVFILLSSFGVALFIQFVYDEVRRLLMEEEMNETVEEEGTFAPETPDLGAGTGTGSREEQDEQSLAAHGDIADRGGSSGHHFDGSTEDNAALENWPEQVVEEEDNTVLEEEKRNESEDEVEYSAGEEVEEDDEGGNDDDPENEFLGENGTGEVGDGNEVEEALPVNHNAEQHHELPADDVIVIDLSMILDGPFNRIMIRVACLALYIFLFVQGALLLPALLGRGVIALTGQREALLLIVRDIFVKVDEEGFFKSDDTPLLLDVNTTAQTSKDTEVLIAQYVVLVEFLLGWWIYSVAALIAVIFLFRKVEGRGWRLSLSNFFRETRKCLKTALFCVLEFTVLPHAIGWSIDIVTIKAFGVTLTDRLAYFEERPMIGGTIHFMIGFSFVNLVEVFLSELRRVLRETMMVRMLPERIFIDHDDGFDALAEQPVQLLVQRVLLKLFYSTLAVVVMVMLPVSVGHRVCPYAGFLKLSFDELYYDIQLPLELLVFQFLIPFLLQKMRHREVIRNLVSGYVVYGCTALGLDDWLDEEVAAGVLRQGGGRNEEVAVVGVEVRDEERVEGADEVYSGGDDGSTNEEEVPADVPEEVPADVPEEEPQRFLVGRREEGWGRVAKTARGLILLLGGLMLLFLYCSWLVHVPLMLGRGLLQYSGIPNENDLYCYCVGSSVVVGASTAVRFIAKELSQSATALLSLCASWLLVVSKSLFVALLWFGLAPLLLGLLFEVTLVIPFRTPLNESPAYPLLQCWALGLLFLNFWLRSLMVGVFGETNVWRVRFDICARLGFSRIDLTFILRFIMAPIFLFILDNLVVPYFLARTLGLLLTQSYFLRTALMRYSFLAYFSYKLQRLVRGHIRANLSKAHTEILDSRYLIGTELSNR